jgi:hypothetical protein
VQYRSAVIPEALPARQRTTKISDLSIGATGRWGRFFHATMIMAAANTNQFSFALRDVTPKFSSLRCGL